MNANIQTHSLSRPAPASKSTPRGLAIGLACVSAVVAVLVRLIPYGVRPPNVAANGSLGLFAGARVPFWLAAALQIASLAVSDLILRVVLGWRGFDMVVYASFLAYLLIGRALIKDTNSKLRIISAVLLGSLQFFLVTNFAVWYREIGEPGARFEPTPRGLIECYIVALPYYGFTLAGDYGFTAVLFGAQAWLYSLVHGAQPVEAPEEAAS